MKISIATDHNGVEQKHEIIKHLESKNLEIIDLSTDNNPTDDYPDFAFRVAKSVKNNESDYGILLCGTGIGMSIAANKVKGIRCAHVSNIDEAYHTRVDNDANMIALSYKNNLKDNLEMIIKFLETPFSQAERHIRRIRKIEEYEESND